MHLTLAEVGKLIKKLNEEYNDMLAIEAQSREFVAALSEDIESVRPDYDYKTVRDQLEALEKKIRDAKHALNCVNARKLVPGFDMTIDQLLIYIPQLNAKKQKLSMMANRLPKVRDNSGAFGRGSGVIDYNFANYDIVEVKNDLARVSEELSKAQTALDVINNTEKIEFEL